MFADSIKCVCAGGGSSDVLNKLFVLFPRIKGLQYWTRWLVVVDVNTEIHYQGFPPKTLSAPAVAESSFNILLILLPEVLGG